MTYQEYKSKYGISLDPDQDKACAETEGHVLLLAVPGSGKTAVMTARLGYLVHGRGVSPDAVLAVTYSVAGVKEMQRRYEAMFGKREVEIRTINGFCAKIIGTYERMYRRTAFRLIEAEGDVSQILRGILCDCGGYPSENELRDVRTAITYCRNRMLGEKEIADTIQIEGRDFPEIFRRYRDFKRERRLMDYDDQLCYGYNILCRYPQVGEAYAGRFRYVCVDEAQDTSKIQHQIIRKAAERCGNLFMVGDEDQSIYGFRAAYPEGLLEFDRIYPDAKVYFIEKNYRSTGTIVKNADRFIAQNGGRREKHMKTDNPAGEEIRHTELSDLSRLPEHIRSAALACADGGGKSTAVLCRLNDSLLPLIDLLSDSGIPYCVRGGDGLFFTHYIVSDICNILRFAADPFNGELFGQLYYKFSCGMNRNDYEYAMAHNFGEDMLSYPEYIASSPDFSENVRKRMKRVADALFRINGTDSYGAIKLVMSSSGYGAYLSHRTHDLTKVNTLLAIAERYRSKKDFFARLEALSGIVKQGSEAENGIVLSTIHSAKGMEFDRVILCDAKNGVLPSITEPANGKQYTEEEERTREEDRRLFYVAVTRAKKSLELVTYRYEFGEKAEGWDYVSTLLGKPEEKAEEKPKPKSKPKPQKPKLTVSDIRKYYSEGDTVMHKVFGEGVILGMRGSFAEVRFYRYPLPKKIDLLVCTENGIIRQI